jgi:hypothetical protein
MSALESDTGKWRGPPCVDPGQFAVQLDRPASGTSLSVRVLWVVTCARLACLGDSEHTRVLHTVVTSLGLHTEQRAPAWPSRASLRMLRAAPAWLRSAFLFNGQAAACVVLAHLLRLVRLLFGEQPVVCDRLERALGEVLTDEVARVAERRAGMSRPVRWVAGLLRRWVVAGFANGIPEVDTLIGRERLLFACESLNTASMAAAAARARGAM